MYLERLELGQSSKSLRVPSCELRVVVDRLNIALQADGRCIGEEGRDGGAVLAEDRAVHLRDARLDLPNVPKGPRTPYEIGGGVTLHCCDAETKRRGEDPQTIQTTRSGKCRACLVG